MTHPNIMSALHILTALGFPRGQINERSALTLLALGNIGPDMPWALVSASLMGITPIMDWIRQQYGCTICAQLA